MPFIDCMKSFQLRSSFWSVSSLFGLNMEIYRVDIGIQSEYRKMWTPYSDIFRAVLLIDIRGSWIYICFHSKYCNSDTILGNNLFVLCSALSPFFVVDMISSCKMFRRYNSLSLSVFRTFLHFLLYTRSTAVLQLARKEIVIKAKFKHLRNICCKWKCYERNDMLQKSLMSQNTGLEN